MNNYFSTVDMNLATFLIYSGIDLRDVHKVAPDSTQYTFEFRIENGSDELEELRKEWTDSDKARNLKRILYASKRLRVALQEAINNN